MEQIKYEFTVPGQPVPKPRMTRRDSGVVMRAAKISMRPQVARYFDYVSRIKIAFLQKGIVKFDRACLTARFFVYGNRLMDLDNLMKSIKDSMKTWLFRDDNIDVIPKYREVEAFRVKDENLARTEIVLEDM